MSFNEKDNGAVASLERPFYWIPAKQGLVATQHSILRAVPISLIVKFRELPSCREAKSGGEDIEKLEFVPLVWKSRTLDGLETYFCSFANSVPMKAFQTVLLLVLSNTFMTFAWYGHLKFKEMKFTENLGLLAIILISWGIAFFEYCLMVPANRIGYKLNGGPFTLMELKVIQEVITLTVFTVFSLLLFKTETFKWNHLAGFACLVLAVFFIFKK